MLIFKAIEYASIMHKDQRRKGEGDIPYINHPIEVMNILVRNGVTDDNTLCIAILHDIIEDTKGTYEDLVRLFNKEIADGVLGCTDDKTLPKNERKIAQIEKTKLKVKEVKEVKIADKISNLTSLLTHPPVHWNIDRTIGYAEWCKSVVVTIHREEVKNELYDNFFSEYDNFVIVNKDYYDNTSPDIIFSNYMKIIEGVSK